MRNKNINFLRNQVIQQAENNFKDMPVEISENKKFKGDFLIQGSIEDWEAEVQKFKNHFSSADRIAQNTPSMNLIMMRKQKIENFLRMASVENS